MTNFPPCHSRRDIEPNGAVAYCAHPRMNVRDQRVNSEVCEICTLRLGPPPETFRAFPPPPPRGPCRHLGDQIALRECATCQGSVRLKVFACRHPAHVETTIQECQVCPDHEERRDAERGDTVTRRPEAVSFSPLSPPRVPPLFLALNPEP